jgi:hypothetical protein
MKVGCWWLTPVILATQEAEVQSQPQRNSSETLSQKNPSPKRKRGWWSYSRAKSAWLASIRS